MNALDRIDSRRAIEALRSGVPNRDAVRALGSSQGAIEARFRDELAAVRNVGSARGLLVQGDFGSGKSHLLEYLRHVALEERFVVSKVVISKETPLYDPAKVFRTAAAGAVLPEKRGAALPGIAEELDPAAPAFADLRRWAESDGSGLNDRFAATLYLFGEVRNSDRELAERIVRFWSGDPIGVGELRRKLREAGEAATYPLAKVSARDLALQRFRFVARLVLAAGYGGWILLFDEAELIARYSVLQRAKSYAEIARWLAGAGDEPPAGLAAVMAMTSDFVAYAFDEKRDEEVVPERLRSRGDDALAELAEVGMGAVRRDFVSLEPPSRESLDATYARLKEIHARAYEWEPPELARDDLISITASMRPFVRKWIYEWDLRRLDPSYTPSIEVGRVSLDYSEEPELEVPPEGARDEREDGF